MTNPIKQVVIVGGGSAGWMTAAALSKVLGDYAEITLVESGDIGTVSVGEATIPQIQLFNKILGIDEKTFVRETEATFKLGIEFIDWRKKGAKYMHPFGVHGTTMDAIPFHHFWLKMRENSKVPDLEEFSLATVAARGAKFMKPANMGNSPLSQINYAYHFDATLYAQFLRRYAESRNVKRIDARISEVELRSDNGFIDSLKLDDERIIKGDLFIDCTGFRSLLIGKALNVKFNDWSHYLPCDRAIAIPSKSSDSLAPYTKSVAQSAGWTWEIPLQHRTGNGYVYPSEFVSDDQAIALLQKKLGDTALGEPNQLRWKTGVREKAWEKNCVAIGLSAGFLEPLESTGLHLIQVAIAKLLGMFPTRDFSSIDRDNFNRQWTEEVEHIRDFIILHYAVTERRDSEFWRYCTSMALPERLAQKIELFKANGRIYREDKELFNETSWLAVMHGQGISPSGYHPLVDVVSEEETLRRLINIKRVIDDSLSVMPLQSEYLKQNFEIDLPLAGRIPDGVAL